MTWILTNSGKHSYLASQIVNPHLALEALLHDAAEAYCKDIPRPLKYMLPDYQAIEERVESAIRERFKLPTQMSPEVNRADLILLATERRDLMPADDTPWPILEGIIPPGHALIFKDGNKRNFALDNLELVSRAELMRRNSVHNYGPEIARIHQLQGAITRQINKRQGKSK